MTKEKLTKMFSEAIKTFKHAALAAKEGEYEAFFTYNETAQNKLKKAKDTLSEENMY